MGAIVSRKLKVSRPATLHSFNHLSKLQVEYLDINELRPSPRNARTHSPQQIRQIERSVAEFGFTNPLLVDDAGSILAGHGRVQAAKRLGFSQVPAIRISHLSLISKLGIVPSHVSTGLKNFGGFFVRNRTDGLQLPGLNPYRNLLFQGAIHMNKFTIASTEEQWRQQAEAARQEAENLPFGKRREALVRRARQLRTASEIDRWLLSPELQRPI
jgi:hypothetical protein